MKLNKKTKGDVFHFVIFERETEEESVLTISKLLIEINVKVTLFISESINKLIGSELNELDIEIFIVKSNLCNAFQDVNRFINLNPVDLIIFTRFSAYSWSDYKLYKQFVRINPVCTLIENYDRWFASVPPIEFNGWKIINRTKIQSWLFCKLMFKYFCSYFICEVNINSTNPFIGLIKNRTDKPIFEFPFKIMGSEYLPDTNYSEPVFVIPGGIAKFRRDYFSVLKIFNNEQIIANNWKLILLGRPIGKYGKSVIEYAKNINLKCGSTKIIYFEKYIEKLEFEKFMYSSTHILAPVKKSEYKFGKSTGAIYDVFKYNKIGIFNEFYFYSNDLPEKRIIITYKNSIELFEIIKQLINGKFNYEKIKKEYKSINEIFNKSNYINYLNNRLKQEFI